MYWSMANFLVEIRARKESKTHDNGFHSFALWQLKDLFIIYLACMIVAGTVFLIELALCYMKR